MDDLVILATLDTCGTQVGCHEKQRRPGGLNSGSVFSHGIGGNEVQGHSAASSVADEGLFVL